MKKILSHPLLAGSLVMVFGSNTVNFLNYLYHVIMGKMLGPVFYGELVALISLLGLLSIIPVSLTLVIVKYVSAAKDKRESGALTAWFRAKGFKISFVLFIFILVISPSTANFLHIDKTVYLLIIAISFLLSIQVVINRAILQGFLKFKETVLSLLAEVGSKIIISLILIFLGFRVGGAMMAFAVSFFVGWYITNLYLKDKPQIVTDYVPDVKKMLIFSFPVLVQSFAVTSLYTSDVILVKHFFSSLDAGIYAALSTLGKIIFFGASPITSVMFPLVSQKESKGESHKKIFIYSLLATTILAGVVLVIYWLVPDLAIRFLYSRDYLAASNLLIWYGIFISIYTLSFLVINYNLSLSKIKVVVFPLIAAVCQVVLIWIYHRSLLEVIFISVIVCTLLLLSLLIYSTYGKRKVLG